MDEEECVVNVLSVDSTDEERVVSGHSVDSQDEDERVVPGRHFDEERTHLDLGIHV